MPDLRSMQQHPSSRRAISRRSFVSRGAFVAVSAAVGGYWLLQGGAGGPEEPEVEGRASVGEPAPRFGLEELRSGRTVSLPREDEPVLLSFSATWCLTCVAELSNFQAVHTVFHGKARIAVVNFQQSRSTILGLVDRLDAPDVSILLDSTGAVTRAFRVNALPAMALIDGQGIVRAVGHEYLSVETVIKRMAEVGVTPNQ